MKQNITKTAIILLIATSLTSCYVNTFNVGKGAQTNVSTSQWNHYLIDGLVPLSQSNPQTMAGNATDYTVTIQHSFVNGLLNVITFGIYSPTTTTVTK